MVHAARLLNGICLLAALTCRAPAAEPEPAAPAAIPAKVLRYARQLVRTYDADGDGRLGTKEWQRMRGNPRQADADGDATITEEELARYIAEYARRHAFRLIAPALGPEELRPAFTPAAELESRQTPSGRAKPGDSPPSGSARPPAVEHPISGSSHENTPATTPPNGPDEGQETKPGSPRAADTAAGSKRFHLPPSRLPPGLPAWFTARDLDGDGQLTLAEFAPRPSRAQIEEFNHLDSNRDGLLTTREVVQGAKSGKTGREVKKQGL